MGWVKSENSVAFALEKAGCLDALEEVQKHPNYEIYMFANSILSKYFEQANDQIDGATTT